MPKKVVPLALTANAEAITRPIKAFRIQMNPSSVPALDFQTANAQNLRRSPGLLAMLRQGAGRE